MNNTLNTTTNNFRLTTMGGRTGMGFFSGNDQENGNAGGQIGVDEMVFDSNSGTFATFQDAPSLTSLLNSRDGACSFVI